MPTMTIGDSTLDDDTPISYHPSTYHTVLASGLEYQNDEYDEEEELEYEDEDGSQGDEEDRESMKKPISTGLARTYVPRWRSAHGFREYYQNWADAIKETNSLGARNFNTSLEDKKSIWLFKALHPATGKLLGFIRFMKKTGMVELTNFRSQLKVETLDLGNSSKRSDENLAGTHGEGYKIACLVMVREGYRVNITTSNRKWIFRFGGPGKRHLHCYFPKPTKNAPRMLQKHMDAYELKVAKGKSREPKANSWEDVTIRIGGGGRRAAKLVTQNDFLSWIQHCIDLDAPSASIKTPCGDLILDSRFSNRMYLKGLLLEGKSRSRPWKYGYNLAQGEVNRDRQQLADSEEQGELITRIWDAAFKTDKSTTIAPYIEMLRAEVLCPDVFYAEENISESMAKQIWQHLLEENTGDKFFYYYSEAADKDVELIQKSLKKEPKSLQRVIWNPLRKFNLVRTPEEQRYHLLHNAPSSTLPETPYSNEFKRALKGVLALDSRTQDLTLDFRSGANAELDLLLDGSSLLINERWLDFHASHQVTSCSLFTEVTARDLDIDCFSCGHILTDLYDLLLVELSKSLVADANQKSNFRGSSLRLKVREGIDQMPCKITATTGDQPQELVVSWVHPESEKANRLHGLDLKGRITLHRISTCEDKASELLFISSNEEDNRSQDSQPRPNVLCGCPEATVSLKNGQEVFRGLDHSHKYFPMISLNASQSFFGQPPPAVSPKEPDILPTMVEIISGRVPPFAQPTSPSRFQPSVDDTSCLDGPSNDDSDDYMDLETTIQVSPLPSSNRSVGQGLSFRSSPDRLPRSIPNSSAPRIHIQASSNLEKQIEDQQKNLDEKENQIRNLRNEIDGFEKKLGLSDRKFQAAKSETQDVRQELREVKKLKEIADREITSLQEQIRSLQTKYEDAVQSINGMDAQIATTETKFGNRHREHCQATAEISHLKKELEEAASQQNIMKEQRQIFEQELRAKENDLQAAKSSIDTLEKNDQDAGLMIEQLRGQIQLLQDANALLEEDLDIALDVNAKQAQLTANRAARIRSVSLGVRREIRTEDEPESSRSPKRRRLENVITTHVGGALVLD